jgi:excinuclease UvrABC ATPase subunit
VTLTQGAAQHAALRGGKAAAQEDEAAPKRQVRGRDPRTSREWWEKTENVSVKEWLGQFMSQKPCPECHGDRLRIEALHVLVEAARTGPTRRRRRALGRR